MVTDERSRGVGLRGMLLGMDHDKLQEQRRELWSAVYANECAALRLAAPRATGADKRTPLTWRFDTAAARADASLAAFDERFPAEGARPLQAAMRAYEETDDGRSLYDAVGKALARFDPAQVAIADDRNSVEHRRAAACPPEFDVVDPRTIEVGDYVRVDTGPEKWVEGDVARVSSGRIVLLGGGVRIGLDPAGSPGRWMVRRPTLCGHTKLVAEGTST